MTFLRIYPIVKWQMTLFSCAPIFFGDSSAQIFCPFLKLSFLRGFECSFICSGHKSFIRYDLQIFSPSLLLFINFWEKCLILMKYNLSIFPFVLYFKNITQGHKYCLLYFLLEVLQLWVLHFKSMIHFVFLYGVRYRWGRRRHLTPKVELGYRTGLRSS